MANFLSILKSPITKGVGIVLAGHYLINLPFQISAAKRLGKSQPEDKQIDSPGFFGHIFSGHASVRRLKGIVERKGVGPAIAGFLFPKAYTSIQLTKKQYGEVRMADWITSIVLPGINNASLSKKIYEKHLYTEGAEDALKAVVDSKKEDSIAIVEKQPIEVTVTKPDDAVEKPALTENTPPVLNPSAPMVNLPQQVVQSLPYSDPIVVSPLGPQGGYSNYQRYTPASFSTSFSPATTYSNVTQHRNLYAMPNPPASQFSQPVLNRSYSQTLVPSGYAPSANTAYRPASTVYQAAHKPVVNLYKQPAISAYQQPVTTVGY